MGPPAEHTGTFHYQRNKRPTVLTPVACFLTHPLISSHFWGGPEGSAACGLRAVCPWGPVALFQASSPVWGSKVPVLLGLNQGVPAHSLRSLSGPCLLPGKPHSALILPAL